MQRLPFEYAVRNLSRAPLRLVASVAGGTLVVLLVLVAGSFVRGMGKSLSVSGGEKNVILLGAGSEESLERSQIGMNVSTLVAASVPGVKRALGVDYVSPEVHMALVMQRDQHDAAELRAVVRGVTPAAFLVHPQVRVVEGRTPRAGEYEVMVGALAATRMGVEPAALGVGKSLWFDHRAWRIVGRMAAPQTVMNAEIWVPLADLQIAKRRDTLSCVVLRLEDAAFGDVAAWAALRLDLELSAIRESDYYANLYAFYGPVRAMIWVTAALIALGGMLGGVNTMYAAFATRVRELGALQTLGFPRRALVLSFLQESMLATSAGAIIAALIALTLLDGVAVRFSMGAFALVMDGPVIMGGLLAAMGLAIVGVIPPLWRCLRLPIVEALRSGA